MTPPIVTPEEARMLEDVALALRSARPVTLTLNAQQAFMLIGELQLALRHPLNNGEPAEFARDVVSTIARALPAQCLPLIARGWSEDALDETSDDDALDELLGACVRLDELYRAEETADPRVVQPHGCNLHAGMDAIRSAIARAKGTK